jgi:predicted HicB family RNase H-like nuclease
LRTYSGSCNGFSVTTKSKQVTLLARPQDAERWRRAAKRADVSLSEWIRRLADAAAAA